MDRVVMMLLHTSVFEGGTDSCISNEEFGCGIKGEGENVLTEREGSAREDPITGVGVDSIPIVGES